MDNPQPWAKRDCFTLRRTEEFCASHFLPGYDGKCAHVHGHNFLVEAEVEGHELDECGLLIDLSTLKNALRALLPDHGDLNEWMDEPPSIENIARKIYHDLRAQGIPVSGIVVWENPRNSVRYCQEDLPGVIEMKSL